MDLLERDEGRPLIFLSDSPSPLIRRACSWSSGFTNTAVIRNRNFRCSSLVLELILFSAVRVKMALHLRGPIIKV